MAYTDVLRDLFSASAPVGPDMTSVYRGLSAPVGPDMTSVYRGLGGGAPVDPTAVYRQIGSGGGFSPADVFRGLGGGDSFSPAGVFGRLTSSLVENAASFLNPPLLRGLGAGAGQREPTNRPLLPKKKTEAAPGQPGQPAATGYARAQAAGGVNAIQLGGLGPGQRDEFFRRAMALGQQIEKESGIPAEVFAAVAANESNFGNTPGNVLFGVKAGPGEPFAELDTWEMVNGVRTPRRERFRTYPTAYEAAQHFVGLMQNERYGPALSAYRAGQTDLPGFVQRVNAAGYATNPNWHQEIAPRLQEAARYRNDPGTQALLNPQVAPAIAQGLEPRPQTAIGTQVRSDTAQRVLANADTWIASNPRYEMIGGATNRQVADCSGFIVGVMNELGIPFRPGVRTAEQIRQVSTSVPRDQAQPGDLVFFQQTYEGMPAGVASHVGIVTGNGIMLDTGGNGLNYRSFQTSGWQSKLLDIRRPPQYGQ